MENNAKASNIQYKPALNAREPVRVAATAKQPSPKNKPEAKGFLYEASGPGLRLSAPKCSTSFIVHFAAAHAGERRKLKVPHVTSSQVPIAACCCMLLHASDTGISVA